MFVSTKIHQQLHDEWVKERVKAETLTDANRTLTTQLKFLCLRVNHLEKERAILLRRLLPDVLIPVPEFTPTSPNPQTTYADAMMSSVFEDMGDEAAKKVGIGWDADGHVKYGKEN